MFRRIGQRDLVGGRGYHVLVLEGDGRPHLTVQPLSRMLAVGGGLLHGHGCRGAAPDLPMAA